MERWRCCRRVHLEDQAHLQAGALPYGQQRRLEIARALATNPKILLLDEPAAGMNPQETQELMDFILKVKDDFGLTVLLIEHDMRRGHGDLPVDQGPGSRGRRSPKERRGRFRITRKSLPRI